MFYTNVRPLKVFRKDPRKLSRQNPFHHAVQIWWLPFDVPANWPGDGRWRVILYFFRVGLNALQRFTSCTPIWSGKVCTQIFLEWEAVHSNIFGVDNLPLQNFHYLWVNNHALKVHSKIWSAPKVHSKSFGVHLKSTPKDLECTQSPLQKIWSGQNSTPRMSYFWSE
jgi:hypothetical protein